MFEGRIKGCKVRDNVLCKS